MRLLNLRNRHNASKSDTPSSFKNEESSSAIVRDYQKGGTVGQDADVPTSTLRLADLLLLLHDRALPMGPDRNEFAHNLALTITQLIDRQIGPSPAPSPSASPYLSSSDQPFFPTTGYSFPQCRAPPRPTPELSQNVIFDDVTSNPMLAQAFHTFLSKSYCSENLEFYDAVDQFRHLWRCSGTASMTDDQRRAMADGAQHIWNHYVAPSATMQINIDSDVVEAIQSQLGTPRATMFDEAQNAVKLLMLENWFGRFVRSPEFKFTHELVQVCEGINSEHARIRKWLGKVAQSESALAKLEERKRELEAKAPTATATAASATLRGPQRSSLTTTPVSPPSMLLPTATPTYRRGMMPPPPPVPAVTITPECGTLPTTSAPAAAAANDSTDAPQQLPVPSPSSSSSSDSVTRRHSKTPWNSVVPHIPKKEKRRSKSSEQLIINKKGAAMRFWQKEPANTDWLLVIGVIQAKDIIPRDMHVTHPYVEIKFGRSKFQTSLSALSDTNPRWREYFTFHVGKDEEAQKVSVKLRRRSGMSNQTLGQLKFTSARSFTSRADRWYPLEPKTNESPVVGELRLMTYYRPQGTKERELNKTLKYLNKSIDEEEKEMAREEQRQKRRHGNLLVGTWTSQDDAGAVAAPAPSPGTKARWRHSALVLLPPTTSSGETYASDRLLKQLHERKHLLERELEDERRRAKSPPPAAGGKPSRSSDITHGGDGTVPTVSLMRTLTSDDTVRPRGGTSV